MPRTECIAQSACRCARRPVIIAMWLLAAVGPLWMAGCAGTPPTVTGFSTPPMGTVTIYHRKSSGSLGHFDGQVVWTQRPGTWQGQPVLAVGAPQVGTTLLDPLSLGMVAALDNAGQPQFAFSPPMDYQWPLRVGQTWSTSYTVTLYPAGTRIPMRVDYLVESWGDVTVPAGTFKAFQLRWTNNLGETEIRWLSPAEGIATIKRHVERSATHPQGAGVLDAALLSFVVPAR